MISCKANIKHPFLLHNGFFLPAPKKAAPPSLLADKSQAGKRELRHSPRKAFRHLSSLFWAILFLLANTLATSLLPPVSVKFIREGRFTVKKPLLGNDFFSSHA